MIGQIQQFFSSVAGIRNRKPPGFHFVGGSARSASPQKQGHMKNVRVAIGIIGIAAALALQVQAQTSLTNGLVAYYPFAGNANDAAGTNNGTVHGATLVADRFGIPSSAYSFDGASSYIQTTNWLPDLPSASASFWINLPALSADGRYVFMDGDTTPGHDFFVGLGQYTNLVFTTKDSSYVQGNIPPLTNTWFQVVCVADNGLTNRLTIWLNGQLIATAPSLGSANVGFHSDLFVGCRAVYADNHCDGLIDDLRIYDRALSSSEIVQLYASESAPPAPQAPQVTQQPQSLTVVSGSPAAFSATVWGTPPLVYQWMENRTNLVDGGRIAGSSASTLLLAAVASGDAATYSLVITNAYGSTTSSAATLTVLAPGGLPTNGLIAYYPFDGDASDAAGTNNGTVYGATLTADRFGMPNSAYSFDGASDFIQTADWLPDMASASASFWIKVPVLSSAGRYIFMDGDDTPGHDFFVGLGQYTNLVFTTKDSSYVQGSIPPLTNTWFQVVCVADNGPNNRLTMWLDGQVIGTAPSLGSANVGYHSDLFVGCRALDDDCQFDGLIDDLRIYNRALSSNEVVQLYASESAAPPVQPLRITGQPQSLAVASGNPAAFTVTAWGAPPLSYQWQKNGTNLLDVGNISGSAQSTLTLATTTASDAAGYTVIVTSAYGSATSSAATLTVLAPPSGPPPGGLVAYYPFNGDANDAVGTNNGAVYGATLVADRFGIPSSAYSFDGASSYIQTTNWLPDLPSASTSFWINLPAFSADGRYVFMDGDTTPGHDFFVGLGQYTNLVFTTKDSSYVQGNIPPLTNTWFQVVCVADNALSNRLTMWLNGQLIATAPSLGSANVGFHSDLFIGCRAVYADNHFDGLIDDLRIYDRALSSNEIVQLYATESAPPAPQAPQVAQQPQSLTVVSGGAAAFSATVWGTPPLVYQWLENGTNLVDGGSISGSSASTLQLATVAPGQAGTYSLVITNAYGGATSTVATLTVLPPGGAATNGLVAYYPFNGNANDAAGTNNGTAYGAALTADRFGIASSAYSFDGASACIQTAGWLPDMPSASASFWINVPAFSESGRYVFMDGNTAPGHDFFVGLGQYTNLVFTTKDSSFVQGSIPPRTNTWFQVVCVADNDGTNLLTMWVNGQLIATAPSLGSANVGYHSDLFIGCRAVYGDSQFDGVIDDLRIYNRALSPDEIAGLYGNESLPPAGLPQGAAATATVSSNSVVGLTVTDSGGWFTNAPLVLIQGGGGTGASGTAVVRNGFVVGVTLSNGGSGYTNTPVVFLGSKPYITSQTHSMLVSYGQSASFSVAALGSSQMGYQWSLNGAAMVGATSAVITVSNVAQSDLGDYSVVVTDPFGSVTSFPVALSMYPSITAPFTGAAAYWGKAAALSVQAVGTGPLAYQWYDNGVPLGGATGAALHFAAVQPTNAGLYSVVVTSPLGTVTNPPALLTVNPAGISLGLYPAAYPTLYPGLTINGVVGYTYTIQRTAALSQPGSWATLTNLTLTQPVQLWLDTGTDASLPGNPEWFYKILPAP